MANKLGMHALILVVLGIFWSTPATAAGLSSMSVEVRTQEGEPLQHAAVALLPVKSPFERSAPEADQTEAVMDQSDRQFSPYVLTVPTGTLVRFPNGDNIRHHVYSFSPAKRFELRLYHGTSAEPVLFDQAGTIVLGCNIHDAMLAYIYVVDSHWHGVTNADGSLQISGLPEGEYSLEVQHPRLVRPVTRLVTVGSEANVTEQFEIADLGPDPRGVSEGEKERSDLQRLFDR